MFSDPEIEKMIIYGLIGVCIVLMAAVVYLAVKKNVYYVDENGKEIPAPAKKSGKFWKPEKPVRQEEEIPEVIPEEEAPAASSVNAIPAPEYAVREEPPVVKEEIEEVVFPEEEPAEQPAEQLVDLFKEEPEEDIVEEESDEEELDLPDSDHYFEEEEPEELYSAETTIMQFPERKDNETLSVMPLAAAEQLAEEADVAPLRTITLEEEDFPAATEEEIESMPVPRPIGMIVTVRVSGHTITKEVDILPCLIGRDASVCNLVISEPAVSRRHARIGYDGKAMYVEDVSEHNGTFVNGKKLPSLGRVSIRENDKINLGRAEITINQFIY